MKCLRKYEWVKLPRDYPDMGKGLMRHWAKLASRAAFRKGDAHYCGYVNPVTPGMWSGGMVGLKSILGVRTRDQAFAILWELSELCWVSGQSMERMQSFGESVIRRSQPHGSATSL